ncbi:MULTISPECIES: hypothetical protein [unclassified Streptomyces]|uniref:hypothetical protein n=1 Tax=unclassified Streptomyces TaxID=2593676 RepID=UPI0038671F01
MRFRTALAALGLAAAAIAGTAGAAAADNHGSNPCTFRPATANGQLVDVLPDVPVLSAPQSQQCTTTSTQDNTDGPLSHILGSIPVLPGSGVDNS